LDGKVPDDITVAARVLMVVSTGHSSEEDIKVWALHTALLKLTTAQIPVQVVWIYNGMGAMI
jgi:hypothetical protein